MLVQQLHYMTAARRRHAPGGGSSISPAADQPSPGRAANSSGQLLAAALRGPAGKTSGMLNRTMVTRVIRKSPSGQFGRSKPEMAAVPLAPYLRSACPLRHSRRA